MGFACRPRLPPPAAPASLQPLDLEAEPVLCPCLEVLPSHVRAKGLYKSFLQVWRGRVLRQLLPPPHRQDVVLALALLHA